MRAYVHACDKIFTHTAPLSQGTGAHISTKAYHSTNEYIHKSVYPKACIFLLRVGDSSVDETLYDQRYRTPISRNQIRVGIFAKREIQNTDSVDVDPVFMVPIALQQFDLYESDGRPARSILIQTDRLKTFHTAKARHGEREREMVE